ncbi:unnamed protein product (macronuclear) [Paramecium tetraurelia]|uniref:PX domain-containing protein n=1 Tax=Paramecium tetraurelia TaxID=5888 RepID=A0CAP5_PARTE|nr:uncharacterized protein GSPATT00036643001 [Paramecium tetraurelia]CAK67862.1 unnamed protein product [Paramecium tetraurelia]|eukprot:XP_001435259.1 hypothetical protein (macronuclear) [Paramecium tetraurelia strain d4-2]
MLPKRQYSFQDQDPQQKASPLSLKRVHSVTSQLQDEVKKYYYKIEKSVYELIFTHQVIKNIEIVSITKEKDNFSLHKKHIVHYVIKITTDYFDYQIQRSSTNKYLIRLFQLKPKFEFFEFPQKKLFKSNKSEVVQERRKSLQKFLQTILSSLDQLKPVEFLEFIEILQQFLRRGFDNIKLHGLSSDQFNLDSLLEPELQKHQPTNDIEKAVICYLHKLNSHKEDRVKIIQYPHLILLHPANSKTICMANSNIYRTTSYSTYLLETRTRTSLD